MTHDAGANLDQLQLQAGEGPIGHGFGQVDAAQERGQVVGQRVELQPHLVVAEPPAEQPCPAKGIFAFLDVLLGGAALVLERQHPIWLHRQVGDDEPDTWEQLARMPLDLGNHPARLVPRRRLILEVFVEALDLGLRRSPNGSGQSVTVMEPVDLLPVQVGQPFPVLGQGQRLGLEPPHLRRRGRLHVDGPTTNDLTHDRIEGQLVGVVHILISSQSPEHRLPEKAVKLKGHRSSVGRLLFRLGLSYKKDLQTPEQRRQGVAELRRV